MKLTETEVLSSFDSYEANGQCQECVYNCPHRGYHYNNLFSNLLNESLIIIKTDVLTIGAFKSVTALGR